MIGVHEPNQRWLVLFLLVSIRMDSFEARRTFRANASQGYQQLERRHGDWKERDVLAAPTGSSSESCSRRLEWSMRNRNKDVHVGVDVTRQKSLISIPRWLQSKGKTKLGLRRAYTMNHGKTFTQKTRTMTEINVGAQAARNSSHSIL